GGAVRRPAAHLGPGRGDLAGLRLRHDPPLLPSRGPYGPPPPRARAMDAVGADGDIPTPQWAGPAPNRQAAPGGRVGAGRRHRLPLPAAPVAGDGRAAGAAAVRAPGRRAGGAARPALRCTCGPGPRGPYRRAIWGRRAWAEEG